MQRSFTHRWWLVPALALAISAAACQSASALMHYGDAIDACKLPDADAVASLVPGTVEIPPTAVKLQESSVMPYDRTTGDNELTSCRKIFARDLGGKQPDVNDYRSITIAVVRYTESDDDIVAPKVRGLMTDAVGDHSGVRLVTGIGDEAGLTDNWAAVRSGNVVMVLAIADGGSEAALIKPPNVDNVQRVVTGMVDNLKRLYAG